MSFRRHPLAVPRAGGARLDLPRRPDTIWAMAAAILVPIAIIFTLIVRFMVTGEGSQPGRRFGEWRNV